MMKNLIILTVSILFFSCAGCSIEPEKRNPNSITVEEVWKTPSIDFFGIDQPKNIVFCAKVSDFSYQAYDLKTGNLLWNNTNGRFYPNSFPIITDDYVYWFGYDGGDFPDKKVMVWFSVLTGDQIGYAKILPEKETRSYTKSIKGSRMYLGIRNPSGPLGLGYLDLDTGLTPVAGSPGEYAADIKVLYPSPRYMGDHVLFKDGMILVKEYFGWLGDYSVDSYITAIDEATGAKLWSLADPYFYESMRFPFHLLPDGSVVANLLRIYRIKAERTGGEVLSTFEQSKGSINGGTVDGDSYYQGASTPDGAGFVTRYRLSDGKIVWRTWNELGRAISQNPAVKNGIVYVAEPDALTLYSAETGKILGRDYSKLGTLMQFNRNESTADLFIYWGEDAYFHAIKMNYRLGPGDTLEKE